jgi:hypothetical protein
VQHVATPEPGGADREIVEGVRARDTEPLGGCGQLQKIEERVVQIGGEDEHLGAGTHASILRRADHDPRLGVV